MQSCDPYIAHNTIEKNYKSGILVATYGELRCDGEIVKNTITCNSVYGIRCIRMRSEPRIIDNLITYNKKAGIKVEQEARPSIHKNKIGKNLQQV